MIAYAASVRAMHLKFLRDDRWANRLGRQTVDMQEEAGEKTGERETGMGECDRMAGERVGGGVASIAGGARGVFADL